LKFSNNYQTVFIPPLSQQVNNSCLNILFDYGE